MFLIKERNKLGWNQIITFILTNYKISRIPAAPRISSEIQRTSILVMISSQGTIRHFQHLNLGWKLEKRKVVSSEKRLGLRYTLKMSLSSLGKIFSGEMINSGDRTEAKRKSLMMLVLPQCSSSSVHSLHAEGN